MQVHYAQGQTAGLSEGVNVSRRVWAHQPKESDLETTNWETKREFPLKYKIEHYTHVFLCIINQN